MYKDEIYMIITAQKRGEGTELYKYNVLYTIVIVMYTTVIELILTELRCYKLTC